MRRKGSEDGVYTAIILAGGRSRRMGRDKLMLPQNGATVLETAVKRFSEKFDRVFLSVDRAGRYPDIPVPHVVDLFPACGPLAGLQAGLEAAGEDGVFLAAADLPFSDPETALRMIEVCGEHEICVMRDERGRFEPLFGWYAVSVLPRAEKLLESGKRAMTELFEVSDTLVLSAAELGIPEDSRMLANMNLPEDYEELIGRR